MDFAENIRKFSYVMRSVKHSVRTSRDLSQWKEDGLKQISLKFKDLQTFENVTLGTAWAMISYYFWAHRINAYNKDDLRELYSIGEEIYTKIKSNCKTWPHGGWGLQGTHGILFLIVRKYKPNLMVETGIASGYSSTVILTAMRQNGFGHLISIDIQSKATICGQTKEAGWLVPATLKEHWTKIIGDSKEKLLEINKPIDVFYHDSEHSEENMLREFNWASTYLKKGGILISDDIDWNRAWKIFLKNNKSFTKVIETVSTGVSIRIDDQDKFVER
ncbi:MAG: class I SAM-dependent methyltransferase [Candidatus Thermoplasmatota archaeon]|nr:class I SAM-dependent methyltransferase [Candidatus Thermoplasmatota archaeon]